MSRKCAVTGVTNASRTPAHTGDIYRVPKAQLARRCTLPSRVTFLAAPTTRLCLQQLLDPPFPLFRVTRLHIYLTKICTNDWLESANTSQSDDLPGNGGLGDEFSSLSDDQYSETEGNGLPSSEDEDDDEDPEDWLDEMDPVAARARVAASIEASVAQEGIGIDPPPALNQAQQAEVERSQAPDLSVEVEQFGGMAGKPI